MRLYQRAAASSLQSVCPRVGMSGTAVLRARVETAKGLILCCCCAKPVRGIAAIDGRSIETRTPRDKPAPGSCRAN